MAKEPTEEEIIADRMHPVLVKRHEQIAINILGWRGGREYIDLRLSRFAGEDDIDWSGGVRGAPNQKVANAVRDNSGSKITGRKDQAHIFPHLDRVVAKIDQNVFSTSPKRPDIDPDFLADADRKGHHLDEIMKGVNSLLTVARWAWIKIDAPQRPTNQEGEPIEITGDVKERLKLRPFWEAISPLKVVDWIIDDSGIVQSVLFEDWRFKSASLRELPTWGRVRELWEPGGVTIYQFGTKDDNKNEIVSKDQRETEGLEVVPWVPTGRISKRPHWFDSIESVNRSIMDLESCNRQNFFNTVFAQMYMPASTIEAVQSAFGVDAERAVTMLTGWNYPIMVGEGEQPPGYIMPDSSAIESLGNELGRLRKEMSDSIGLMKQQESRQVASGESKAFDQQDVAQVMGERAKMLEDAERKGAEITHLWDDTQPLWEPQYTRDFTKIDPADVIPHLTSAAQMSMPPELYRLLLDRVHNTLADIGGMDVTPEETADIIAAIAIFDPSAGLAEVIGGAPDIDGDTGVPIFDVSKIPLQLQQLGLARERTISAGDVARAEAIGKKIDELLAKL